MNLESVIQSEVSQKEKNKYRILTHICAIQKMVQMNLFVGQQQRHRCREWTCGHGGEGEGGTNMEIRFDINTIPCVKQTASQEPAVLHRELSSVLCDDLDGWDGRGGREVREAAGICIRIADSLCCTAETDTTL